MKLYKPKARYEGGGISGVTRIIQATDDCIATNFGTFVKRGKKCVWCVNYAVQLFPVLRDAKP